MKTRTWFPLAAFCLMAALCAGTAGAQVPVGQASSGRASSGQAEAAQALAEARRAQAAAQRRAELLELEARKASAEAERTARESAALAARIQQAEAGIAASEAEARLIARRREVLRARLAARQAPLMRLTAALQRLSRRPAALSLLRPGSLRETVHLRAMLGSMLPEVRRRTAALRAEIAGARRLQLAASANAARLRSGQGELARQRQALAALETRQRLASRAAGGNADREAERALALGEQAQDLTQLMRRLDEAGALRRALAALPGPVLRPERPGEARTADPGPGAAPPSGQSPLAGSAAPAGPYLLPVSGRLVSGFGGTSRGIALAARPGAQAVAPGSGRVAFAGPYRGFGQIVIIEHPGGWTSLVTGLGQLDVRVGQTLVAGSPIGQAGPGASPVGLELRRGSQPVNPLEALKER